MCKSASQLMKYFQTTKSFDKVLQKLKIVTLENGCALAQLKVEEEHTNLLGGLHGGFSATLVDMVSSFALYTEKNGNVPSVSVDMHMTYCNAAKMCDEILITAKTTKAGKSLAYLEVLIENKATGEVLVRGSHTKYLLRPK